MLKEALKKRDFNEDAWILAKAAVIVRKDIFNHEGFKFTGSFQQNCQERSVPSSLKSLISLWKKQASSNTKPMSRKFLKIVQYPSMSQ